MLFAATAPTTTPVAKTDTAKAKVAVKAPDTTRAKVAVKAPVVKPAKLSKISGTVLSADILGSTITVQVNKVIDTFSVTADTKFIKGTADSKFSDVVVKSATKVTYKVDSGKKIATKIWTPISVPVKPDTTKIPAKTTK